jgi:hypothetical protein
MPVITCKHSAQNKPTEEQNLADGKSTPGACAESSLPLVPKHGDRITKAELTRSTCGRKARQRLPVSSAQGETEQARIRKETKETHSGSSGLAGVHCSVEEDNDDAEAAGRN